MAIGEDKTQTSKQTDKPVHLGSLTLNEFYEALPKPKQNRAGKGNNSTKNRIYNLSKKRPVKIILAIVLVFIIGFGGGWVGESSRNNGSLSIASSPSSSEGREIVSNQSELISSIANNVSPSVVSIDAIGTAETQDIFGNSAPQQEESEGTGIILTSTGYVLTNRHVIPQGTTTVNVILADGTTINNVQVVGTTAQSDPLDLAILKISNPPEKLQPATLGDSSTVQVGDSVVAIGNALGQFQNTVTSGIVSGRGRSIQAGDSTGTESEDLQDLIQTDAAINEGNSGGPLVDVNGDVIGINTAVASGTAQNIGFAIPINDAEGIIKKVLTDGQFQRPYLGVYYVTLNPSVAKQYNLSTTVGAYIPPNQNGQPSVLANSPASAAGLQSGDIITAVNGSTISTNNSLSSLVDENPVGSKINLTVTRSGHQITVTVTVGNEPSS
ncbi:MAG TPA: trypsin-like peptidase domain-containing protein [Candidatus Saccharimonadales bacterium]|nr:trypsin-like peptidase domain-containing protein [Candidatus Saccharimonadales bacterium]